MGEFAIHIATTIALYGLLAVSLNFQAGYAGLINFGQVIFFGCGAYGLGLMASTSHALGSGLLLALCLGFAAAVMLAYLGRRISADYWGIATLAVAEIFRTIATNEDWLTGGAQGIAGLPTPFGVIQRPYDRIAMLLLAWSLLAVTILILIRLTRSPFGRALRLLREEPNLAAALGHDVQKLKQKALIIASLPAVLGGFLFAGYFTFVGPDQLYASETFLYWSMIIIGGLGNNLGAVTGAGVVLILYATVPFLKDWLDISSDAVGALRLAMVGAALLAFLMWRPSGLLPERLVRPPHGR